MNHSRRAAMENDIGDIRRVVRGRSEVGEIRAAAGMSTVFRSAVAEGYSESVLSHRRSVCMDN